LLFVICYLLGPERPAALSISLLIFLATILRLLSPAVETGILSVTVVVVWLYFLHYCRGFYILGPFVVMIVKMITGDIVRFGTIFLLFIIGFSQGVVWMVLTLWGSRRMRGISLTEWSGHMCFLLHSIFHSLQG